MFDRVVAFDWAKSWHGRAACCATRDGRAWRLDGPFNWQEAQRFLQNHGVQTLIGFDHPIGVPAWYGEQVAKRFGILDFPSLLQNLGTDPWQNFNQLCAEPIDITLTRPFYPAASRGSRRTELVESLGAPDFSALMRACEYKTSERSRPAQSLFWTSGPSVGRAALAGWYEIIKPMRRAGAKIWPFDGALAGLAGAKPVIAEIYPAEAYQHLGLPKPPRPKANPKQRLAVTPALKEFTAKRNHHLSHELRAEMMIGFTDDHSFDAFCGLLSMLDVAGGRRNERAVNSDDCLSWEGWILGQTSNGKIDDTGL